MQFLVVYIREAHPVGGRGRPRPGPQVEEPVTLDERFEVAQSCMNALDLHPIPAVIDTMDNATSEAYDAWPDRLYLVGVDGRLAFRGDPGPKGFRPDDLEAAIREALASDAGAGR